MTKDEYLIDGHKLLWHTDRLQQWQNGQLISPIYIEISPVSYCNHKCIFCGVDFAMEKETKLDADILCRRLKEMGESGVRSIMYAGEGEPLIHKDLPEIIRTTKESGIDAAMTTNGTLGNAGIWEKILPYLTWVKFSVDAGSADVYSDVHKVPAGSFDKTIRSIKDALLVKEDNKLQVTVGVQFLVIDENIDDLKNAMELFSGYGIDYFVIKPYSKHPQMLKKHNNPYSDETLEYLKGLVSEYEDKSGMRIIFREKAFNRYSESEINYNHCHALYFWGYISASGSFYTCSVFMGDERFKAGNIYDDDMNTIMFGQKRQKAVHFGESELKIHDVCRLNCRMARVNEFLEFLKDTPRHINFV